MAAGSPQSAARISQEPEAGAVLDSPSPVSGNRSLESPIHEKTGLEELYADTPLFREPSIDAEIVGVLPEDTMVSVSAEKTVVLRRNPMVSGFHPISLRTCFWAFNVASGGQLWASRDLGFVQEKGTLVFRVVPRQDCFVLFLVVALSVLGYLWWLYRHDLWRRVFFAPSEASSRDSLQVLGAILLVYFAGLCWILFFSGNLIAMPTDEISYFHIASDILACRRPVDWDFNISVAVLYIPLIILAHAHEYLDIMPTVLFINCCVLTPGIIALAFLIAKKLTGSLRCAALASLLLILFPFIYYPIELHAGAPGEPSLFKAFCGLPGFHPMSYRLYYLFVWCGYNGLGDTPSTFLVLLSIYLGLFAARGYGLHIATSLVFGLACLMRINNIFFAPLIALFFWRRLGEELRNPGSLILRITVAVLSAGIVIAPQFVANWLQFGDVWTFPYVFHTNRAAEGFNWSDFWGSTRYIMNTNWFYVAMASACLYFQRDRQVARVLSIWILPLLFFFCGYTVVGASPMRFTFSLYPAFMISMVSLACWWHEDVPLMERGVLFCVLVGNLVLVSPCARFSAPLPFFTDGHPIASVLFRGLAVLVPLASFWVCIRYLRDRSLVRFSFVWLIVYHSGEAILPLVLLLSHFLREIYLWSREVWSFYVHTEHILLVSGSVGDEGG